VTQHLLAQLACLGTHTVTGLLQTCGAQFQDWSADYRLYERSRIAPEQLFEPVRQCLCERSRGPLVTAMDETCLRKTGKKVQGAKYLRDPLGPPFRVNFIWAQRFLQTSLAAPGPDGQARMIPIDWVHAPLPQKPRPHAEAAQWDDWRAQSKTSRIAAVGADRLHHLRSWFDAHGAAQRPLWSAVDGSFTNGPLLKNLPPHTVLLGRIRSDAKLYFLPDTQLPQGRPRVYGPPAPTPEQLRQDPSIPWQSIDVFFGGQRRTLRVKQLGPLRWRTAGAQHDLQLIVIAPTPYRLSKNGKLLYRKPAFLICTDPHAPLSQAVQAFLWRWDIELNFRDEKTLLGLGDAQVRTAPAVQNLTGSAVAAYALLLCAALQCQHRQLPCDHLPAPKWQRKKSFRPTTMHLIQNLRYELWAQSILFSGFTVRNSLATKPQKFNLPLDSALFYTSSFS
jgi:hypothetical protein